MNSIDLSPLYRSSIGYDRLAHLIDNALSSDHIAPNYPPYNIEVIKDNQYSITLAVAGFELSELDIKVEKGVLTVRGRKDDDTKREYLHHGIAYRTFERKFNLADYVEVTGANLDKGLLTISLVKEIPEAMKPRSISISDGGQYIEHDQKASDKSLDHSSESEAA